MSLILYRVPRTYAAAKPRPRRSSKRKPPMLIKCPATPRGRIAFACDDESAAPEPDERIEHAGRQPRSGPTSRAT